MCFVMRLLTLPSALCIFLLGGMLAATAQVEPAAEPPVERAVPEQQSAPAAASEPQASAELPEASAPVAQSEPGAQSAPVQQSAPVEQSAPVVTTDPSTAPSAPVVDAESAPLVKPQAIDQATQNAKVIEGGDSAVTSKEKEASIAVSPLRAEGRVLPVGVAPHQPELKSQAPESRLPPANPKMQSKIAQVPPTNLPASLPAPMTTTRSVTPPVNLPTPSGPGWIKGCKAIQMQGAVLMCDADSLLTMPSDKVQVYVRNPTLITREGHFTVRESLPMRYRFFLLQ